MGNSIIHDEERVIQEWLNKDCYKIVKSPNPYNIYCINALKEYNSYIFDLEIQYDYEKRSILLRIIYLGEIEPDKYSLCLELLNYLNSYSLFSFFFLDPETVRLSYTKVIANVDHLGQFDNLTEVLEVETSIFIKENLVKIIGILKEDIGIGEAIQRIIGDVSVVRPLLGSKVSKPLKELI